ncbi:thioesterase domain-containing protein [Streptomyces lydicus]|nr:thioesterase domain-containing protein [Streptomyces lydicus]
MGRCPVHRPGRRPPLAAARGPPSHRRRRLLGHPRPRPAARPRPSGHAAARRARHHRARRHAGDEETAYWAAHAAADKPVLGDADAGRAPRGKLDHHTIALSAHATAHLLELAQRGRATVPALLLAALHRALKPITRGECLYAFVEGHGRDDLATADQLVGWFTSLYPVLLREPAEGQEDGEHLLATAEAFRAQLAAVPRGGAGYATTRYLHPGSPLGSRLAAAGQPEITFNYLGHHTSDPKAAASVRALSHPAGETIGADNVLPTALHVTAAVHEGLSLRVHFTFDSGFFAPGAIDAASGHIRDELERTARVEPLNTRPYGIGRSRRRHFLVHPVDGQVHWYIPLAQTLGRVGWDSYGLSADTEPEAAVGIPELAARYVERIRRVQPTGPYTLTGWSFGAAVAYEMTRLLQEAGDRVSCLVLLDPPPLPAGGPGVLADQIMALLPDRPTEQVARAAACALTAPADEQLAQLMASLHLTAPGDAFVLTRLEMLLRHHRALTVWTPTGMVEQLHLVQPAATATAAQHYDRWLAHGRTTAHSIAPGDHRSMLYGDALDDLATLYSDSPVGTE